MKQIIELIKEAARLMTDCDRAAVSAKGRSNFVTDVDVAVQEFMRHGLQKLYPTYGFFSEEQENHPDFEKPLWILDPIDGTANFVSHYRQSALSLALWQEGEVQFGAVYNPFTDELFTAEKGKGAFLNGNPIRADEQVSFEGALIDLGTMPYYKDWALTTAALAREIILRASDLRRCGSAALALCHAADGRVGAMMEGILQPWDYAAGALIAREAGAVVSNWKGEKLEPKAPSSVVAAAPQIYNKVLALIQEVAE